MSEEELKKQLKRMQEINDEYEDYVAMLEEHVKLYKNITMDISIEEIEIAHDLDTLDEFKTKVMAIIEAQIDEIIKEVVG
jgi:hypothetical protein